MDTGLRWADSSHLELLNTALLDVARGSSRYLMVFMPPGHGKSSIISEAFPAWTLGMYPDTQIILSTYGQEFSEQWGRKARDLAIGYGGLFNRTVRQDSQSVSAWRIANHRGVMYSLGVGGPTTGKRADLALIDDPVKNQEEAQSAVFRDMLYRWFQQTLYTRLTPTGRIVLCMTRWHHDDLAGRLIADMEAGHGLPWRIISLPALAEDNDPLAREPGAPLWPALYDAERLAEVQRTLTPLQWLAMYQQRPTPDAGETYRIDWFSRRYRELPNLTGGPILAVDSAFKDGVGNDATAIEVWGRTATDFYLLDCLNVRVQYPELISLIRATAAKHSARGVYIEDKASGQSAVQTLRRETSLAVIPVPAKGSKQQRADGNAPLWAAGKVWLPESGPAHSWIGDFIQQHVLFPRAPHDDMVDASNIGLDALRWGVVTQGPRLF